MNRGMESSIKIEERAAVWLARRDSEAWSATDEAAFNAWLEQSTLHVVAFVRLEAAWKQAKRLKALSAGVNSGDVPSPEGWQLTSFFDRATRTEEAPTVAAPTHEQAVPGYTAPSNVRHTRLTQRWAVAASLLVAFGASIAFYKWPFDSIYRTPVGGTAAVPIGDGSNVTLNTDSRIRLDITDTERRVELQKGEAFFDVAKDPSRPFVVQAGEKRVVAVGTQFSVRRDEDEVRVFVTEGKVRIEDETESSHDKKGDGEILTLSAGNIARTGDAGVIVDQKTISEVEGYLSWRTGYLIFRDTPLADAVAEFNRYNARKIVIRDPVVAAIRVSGKFRSTQFEAFVRILEDGFPVRARRVDDQIVLTDGRALREKEAALQ